MEEGKITERQLAFLFFNVLIATVVFYNPQIVIGAVGQDAWMTALMATIWGFLVVVVMISLGRRFPGLTMIGYIPQIIGKPLGLVLNLLYVMWFLFIGAGIAAQFSLFMNTTIMPYTPPSLFIITFMGITFYAVRSGLEVFARVNELLIGIIVIALLIVVILPYNLMDIRRLLPIGEVSFGNLLATSIVSGSWRGEVMMVGMFLPALASFKNTTRNLLLVVLLVGLGLAAVDISVIAVFGSQVVVDLELPAFFLARVINVAKILNRLEALVVIVWVFGTFIKVCVFLYCATRATAETLRFNKFQFLLLPMTLLFIAVAHNQFIHSAQFVDFLSFTWPGYGLLTFELGIPLILLTIASLRGMRKEQL